MSRIVFESARPIPQVDPGRADVACFVGLVRCIPGAAIPTAVQDWLTQQGWLDGPYARPLSPIEDIPIAVETYSAYTALFDAGGSPESEGTDYVSAAVRTFFAQGGKKCYIVRMADPVDSSDSPETKAAKLQKLLPARDNSLDDQRGWHGVGHVAGLSDVSFLVLPDLPVLTASAPAGAQGQTPVTPAGPEQFQECSTHDLTATPPPTYGAAAPRLTPDDYGRWAAAVRSILQYLSNGSLRELQLVAALPLPQHTGVATAAESAEDVLSQDIHDVIAAQMSETAGLDSSISSAFLQLAYPWIKTTSSGVLLETLEPPDGALAGILARNALTRGTFTNAVKVVPAEIYDIWPALPHVETQAAAAPLEWGTNRPKPLIERISLFGFTPSGLRLLSDVTTYPGEGYRPASIHRLTSVILRAARRLGEEAVFQINGPALWARAKSYLTNLMTRLWQLGALDGATAAEAFTATCDRSTMTQNDLDNGRLVAVVSFNAAPSIEVIRVTLAMETSGASAQEISAVLAEAS